MRQAGSESQGMMSDQRSNIYYPPDGDQNEGCIDEFKIGEFEYVVFVVRLPF